MLRRTLPAPDAPPGLLAAIDLGSNSFRLELAEVQHGRYRRVDYLKETVRLGGGLDAQGLLTEVAMLRGLDCLERFAHRLGGLPASRVRAVATQTLREASNRDAFLARARSALGHDIEVISGREEARLIFGGVARLQPSDRSRLVIDIGGRSTEMIIGTGRTPDLAESFQVGSVSLAMRFFGDGRLTPSAFRAAQVAAGAQFEEALTTFTPGRWTQVLGASGTVGAVAQVLRGHTQSETPITAEGLRWCIERCIEAGHHDRLLLEGLKPERRPIFAAGLCILYTLVTHFRIEALWAARGALRQGVIFELADRLPGSRARPGDLRDHSVGELQRRFGADLAQARRVRALAGALLEGSALQPDPEAAQELAWAADLHEIGMMVSHHDHHRHSAYLVAHVDAPGFSQSQQRAIGLRVLAQRGGLRKVQTALADDAGLAHEVLCLRLAIILCHAREDLPAGVARMKVVGGLARLQLDERWAQSHPRAMYLLAEEIEAWKRSETGWQLEVIPYGKRGR